MWNIIKSCLNGLTKGIIPWLLFGLLVPILFFIFHPWEPIFVFGVSLLIVVLYLSTKWSKGMSEAKKATQEAEQKGAHFTDVHPTDEEKESPKKRFENKFYPMMWTWILSACMLSCSYQMIHTSASKPKGRTVAVLRDSTQTTWSTENIVMAHLEDSTQYVTNSDSILSQETVSEMNTQLGSLDRTDRVKPAVIICRALTNNDTYRTAVDLINQYEIGHKETGYGICIVVAYDQKQYTIGTSRDLESELTDIECTKLARTYLEPFMKSEQPDSAMLYLTNGMCEYIHKKLSEGHADIQPLATPSKKGWLSKQSSLNMLIILILCMLWGYLDERNKWTKPSKPKANVMTNPSEEDDSTPEKKTEKEPKETPAPNKGGSYGGGKSGGGGTTGKW